MIRKFFIAMVAMFCVCTTLAQRYSTNFTLTENPISEGGKWVNGESVGFDWNNVLTAPGEAFGAHLIDGPRYADCIAHLNTSFVADQFAQGTVSR